VNHSCLIRLVFWCKKKTLKSLISWRKMPLIGMNYVQQEWDCIITVLSACWLSHTGWELFKRLKMGKLIVVIRTVKMPFLSAGVPGAHVTLNFESRCYNTRLDIGLHLIKMTGIKIMKESGCVGSALPSEEIDHWLPARIFNRNSPLIIPLFSSFTPIIFNKCIFLSSWTHICCHLIHFVYWYRTFFMYQTIILNHFGGNGLKKQIHKTWKNTGNSSDNLWDDKWMLWLSVLIRTSMAKEAQWCEMTELCSKDTWNVKTKSPANNTDLKVLHLLVLFHGEDGGDKNRAIYGS